MKLEGVTFDKGFPVLNGVRLHMAFRIGDDGVEQNAMIGEDGKIYSPIFKTVDELSEWFKEQTGIGFIPLGRGQAVKNPANN